MARYNVILNIIILNINDYSLKAVRSAFSFSALMSGRYLGRYNSSEPIYQYTGSLLPKAAFHYAAH